MKNDIICWWSGGVTSAVAIWITIQIYGIDRCRIVFINTFNEHEDTYRFKKDCEKWYGKQIEEITAIGEKYKKIQDVWFAFLSLNVANGAICSTELKRAVRENFERENKYNFQVFGFDISEANRALSMKLNYPNSRPMFPLLMHGLSKRKCIEELRYNFIDIPVMYMLGFHNNNCFVTGCVQGGIGYWQKMFKDFKIKFLRMAVIERWLSDLAGRPITINKDQSKEAKKKQLNDRLVFLVYNPKYPNNKSLLDFKPQKIESLIECNGFCGTNDLKIKK